MKKILAKVWLALALWAIFSLPFLPDPWLLATRHSCFTALTAGAVITVCLALSVLAAVEVLS